MGYKLAIIAFAMCIIGTTAYDTWFVASGFLGKSSYLPGIYPSACIIFFILFRIGVRIARKADLCRASK